MRKILNNIPLICLIIDVILAICILNGIIYGWMYNVIVVATGIFTFNFMRIRKKKKERRDSLIQSGREIVEKFAEKNKNEIFEILNEFENLVKSDASFYTAQKVYVKIRRHLDDPEKFLFEEERINIENILKPLEKQMLDLELVR